MNTAQGELCLIDGREYYRISDFLQLKPFLFTLATASDLWIHLSSRGAVTAGRVCSDRALFPYVQEDVLHHDRDTGAKTLIRVQMPRGTFLWQPFDTSVYRPYEVRQNLYKTVLGDGAVFEEINDTLGLTFRYSWQTSDLYGLVRTAWLESHGQAQKAEILDGLVNLLPAGVTEVLQKDCSATVDGYKRAEFADDRGTAVYSMTAGFADTPEAKEVLRAAVVWHRCTFKPTVSFSQRTLESFARGERPVEVPLQIGQRCAYLMHFEMDFQKEAAQTWIQVADTALGYEDVVSLCHRPQWPDLEADLRRTEQDLWQIVAKADGLQLTGHRMGCVHHLSNVMYNNMRGGVFLNNYDLDWADFGDYLEKKNKTVLRREREYLRSLAELKTLQELKERLLQDEKWTLYRLTLEYIPVRFSRRHGDPSRPWNQFSIVLKDARGKPITYYEGNWRDVFQNWEALCMSFPEYYEHVITKFLNCSTAEGYNPLKIHKYGFQWETPVGMSEWASIGYSGDHQVVYLARLLDRLEQFDGAKLENMFRRDIFTYADTPYELSAFEQMLQEPKWTLRFEEEHHRQVEKRAENGEDYRLLLENGEPCCVSFGEKLAVPALSKLSNLVPGGGIWMNTQKAEWNDANNAIVGYGLSVVTVCHLRHYLTTAESLLRSVDIREFPLSGAVDRWMKQLVAVLEENLPLVQEDRINDRDRFRILRQCSTAFEEYRGRIRRDGLGIKQSCTKDRLLHFLELARIYTEHTIRKNRRDDGMYHSYNILSVAGDSLGVMPLQLMLEGQVAVLDCGILTGGQSAALLQAMENSELYSRRDESYYLYPAKLTPAFLEKNCIPEMYYTGSALLQALEKAGRNDLTVRDMDGGIHFRPEIVNVRALKKTLEKLRGEEAWSALVREDWQLVLDCYEAVFHHSRFIGRSQIMYKYEGIGCIYWHQNSKLRVAVQESLLRTGDPALAEHYDRICRGLCYHKTVSQWGAFPMDCYSHTPYDGGASQPVMTGQVKENILARWAELGLTLESGCIRFRPEWIHPRQWLREPGQFLYQDLAGQENRLQLPANALALTLCQVPVVVQKADARSITVYYSDGTSGQLEGLLLPAAISREIFDRSGIIREIVVQIEQK